MDITNTRDVTLQMSLRKGKASGWDAKVEKILRRQGRETWRGKAPAQEPGP